MSELMGDLNVSNFGRHTLQDKFDSDKLDQAIKWVKDTFSKFIVYEEGQTYDDPYILERSQIVSKEDRRRGNTNLPVGTEIRIWITVSNFAKVYFDIITDDSIPYHKQANTHDKVKDKIACIIAFDKANKLGHAGYLEDWRKHGKI